MHNVHGVPRIRGIDADGPTVVLPPHRITSLRIAMLGQQSHKFISWLCDCTKQEKMKELMCEKSYEHQHPSAGSPVTVIFSESYLYETYTSMLETNVESCDCIMVTYDKTDEQTNFADVKERLGAVVTRLKQTRDRSATPIQRKRQFLVFVIGIGNTSDDYECLKIEQVKLAFSASFTATVNSKEKAHDTIDSIIRVCEAENVAYMQNQSAASSAQNSPLSIASSSSSSSSPSAPSSALSSPLSSGSDLRTSPVTSGRGSSGGGRSLRLDSTRDIPKLLAESPRTENPKTDCSMQ